MAGAVVAGPHVEAQRVGFVIHQVAGIRTETDILPVVPVRILRIELVALNRCDNALPYAVVAADIDVTHNAQQQLAGGGQHLIGAFLQVDNDIA